MNRTITWLSVVLLVVSLAVVGGISLQARPGSQGVVSQAYAGDPPGHHAHHGCGNKTLKGAYGGSFSSSTLLGGTTVVVGLLTFDGKGGVTAALTANLNGTVLKQGAVGGYDVNPDCTGSLTLDVGPGVLEFKADGVIVNDGDELLFISTIPALVTSGVAKRL